ncbi:hypothetical protein [Parabacteroides sp.]|uniref:hypothetical protein n=1 Tax=Parabacteroides sp. TaxID=1869337 RepID=UPI002580D915|nr:hypothetical protein [Parabacteroides sp.]
MNKLYMSVKYVIFLTLAVLLSACSEEGIVTLVLEEDEPRSVSRMIVGQWRADHAEWADEDGNVIEEPSVTDIPELNFEENGIGYFGDGINGGNTGFNWEVDESGDIGGSGKYDDGNPTITFNGQRWYIFQLTKSMLILYRITDRYIIIYYYYRVGDYNVNNEPEPSVQSEARVYKIKSTLSYDNPAVSTKSEIYTFNYDDQGRIREYSISNGNYVSEFNYIYNGAETVYVEGNEPYKGLLKDGRLVELYTNTATASPKLVASPIYNEEGYMASVNNMDFIYEAGNMTSVAGSSSMDYSYEYSDLENNANIDLNSIISNYSKMHEYKYSHYSLFAPFGFYGEFSENLISKEFLGDYADFYYEYAYEKDSEGRISIIICKCIDKYRGSVFNTTTFEVFYEVN